MGQKTGLPWLIFAQLIVTIALLGTSILLNDGAIQNLVLGAVIAHWLRESNSLGQQVSNSIEVKRQALGGVDGGVTPSTSATSDDALESPKG